jgi:hypothetical protein
MHNGTENGTNIACRRIRSRQNFEIGFGPAQLAVGIVAGEESPEAMEFGPLDGVVFQVEDLCLGEI